MCKPIKTKLDTLKQWFSTGCRGTLWCREKLYGFCQFMNFTSIYWSIVARGAPKLVYITKEGCRKSNKVKKHCLRPSPPDTLLSFFLLEEKIGKIPRHLQHNRFSEKNNDMSHRVAYTTCRISYIYCIRLNTKCRISWVYYHRYGSWKVAYLRISILHVFI